jgi:hypothetical protein
LYNTDTFSRITFTAEARRKQVELECMPFPEIGTEVGQPGRVRDGDIRCYLPETTGQMTLDIKEFDWNSTLERIDMGPVFPWYN